MQAQMDTWTHTQTLDRERHCVYKLWDASTDGHMDTHTDTGQPGNIVPPAPFSLWQRHKIFCNIIKVLCILMHIYLTAVTMNQHIRA